MSTNTNNRKQNELGAVWLKKSKDGKTYYSGKMTVNGQEIQFVMFKNDHKEPNSSQPDWRIYKSNPMPSNPSTSTSNAPRGAAPRPAAPRPRFAPTRPQAVPAATTEAAPPETENTQNQPASRTL